MNQSVSPYNISAPLDLPSITTLVVTTRVATQTITVQPVSTSTSLPLCPLNQSNTTIRTQPCHALIAHTSCSLGCIADDQDANLTARCFAGVCRTGRGYIGYDLDECPYCDSTSTFCFNTTFGASCVALGHPQDPCQTSAQCDPAYGLICKFDVNTTTGPWTFGYCDTPLGKYGPPSLTGTFDLRKVSSVIFAMVAVLLIMGVWAIIVVRKGVREAKKDDYSDGMPVHATGDRLVIPVDVRKTDTTFGTLATTRTDISSFRPSEKSFWSGSEEDGYDSRFSFVARRGKPASIISSPKLTTVKDEHEKDIEEALGDEGDKKKDNFSFERDRDKDKHIDGSEKALSSNESSESIKASTSVSSPVRSTKKFDWKAYAEERKKKLEEGKQNQSDEQ